jgi:hypothetical protein
MADEWTKAQLYRIAASLRLMGYRDAAAFVALAGRSVETEAKVKPGRRHRLLDTRNPAAALDPSSAAAVVVPLPSRRGSS